MGLQQLQSQSRCLPGHLTVWANQRGLCPVAVGGVGCVLHFLSSVHSQFLYPPPHPPGGPGSFQDDGVSADAAGGLEGGGASGAASDCAASDCAASGWLLEGFGAWMGALGGAGWGWLTWTESCGRCWATAAGLARMSCGVGRPAVRWTVGAVAAGLAAACANCVATGLAWMSCVMWPDGLPCMSVASWLAGMVMMVIFSPALEPAGSIVGRAWMTSLGGALAEALPIVTGTPVVRMEEEFNVTWPNELVMTSGMALMGLRVEAQEWGVTSLLCTASQLHHGRRIHSLIYMTGHILTGHRWKYETNGGWTPLTCFSLTDGDVWHLLEFKVHNFRVVLIPIPVSEMSVMLLSSSLLALSILLCCSKPVPRCIKVAVTLLTCYLFLGYHWG